MRRREHRVEALLAGARLERDLAAGQDAVHREPVAAEVVAGRVEDDEVHAGGRQSRRSRPERSDQANGLSSVLKSARTGIAVPFG